MIEVGIVGASGYAGSNLLQILENHDHAEVKIAASSSLAGKALSDEFPGLNNDLVFTKPSLAELNKMDVVFLAVPHKKAAPIAKNLKTKIIDLTSDHRLSHTYGLPELYSEEIPASDLVANPGCYATACILAAYPLKDIIDYAVFDCISGYSGGGKNPPYDYKDNIIAYKITDHFHAKEIEMALGKKISFTPHVVDTFKGIMCTAHLFLNKQIPAKEAMEKYSCFYGGTFTKVVDYIPDTKRVNNTPFCHMGGFETVNNELVVISVIDNLMKGASSQAIENMNLMFGFDHKEGLAWLYIPCKM